MEGYSAPSYTCGSRSRKFALRLNRIADRHFGKQEENTPENNPIEYFAL